MLYKKILIPIDGSKGGLLAVEQGVRLAELSGAHATILHVINFPGGKDSFESDVASNLVQEEMKKQGEKVLEKVRSEVGSCEVTLDTKLRWGEAANEILQEAKEGKYDLIVIGSRGLSNIEYWLMGSISQRVVRHAKCPVLVVR